MVGSSASPTSFFCGWMMLAPIGSVASTVDRDLGEEQFGGQPALGEMGSDSLLCSFRRNLRVEENQYRRASSAKGGAENAGLSSEFLERGKQRTERRAIGLVDAIFERRRAAGQDGLA